MPGVLVNLFKIAFKIGGPGSGNFGHAGRSGLVGGGAPLEVVVLEGVKYYPFRLFPIPFIVN